MTKLCECGCGEPAPIVPTNNKSRGWIKGEPMRFVHGHQQRGKPFKPVRYIEEDRGYETPCWIWQLHRLKDGYGRLGVDGRMVLAHRYYYEQHRGLIPKGLEIDHLCRNPECVNPWHLEPVTHSENAHRGLRSKLTADDVRQIRRLEGVVSRSRIARQFDITLTTVGHIIRRVTWRDVEEVVV